MTRVLTTITRNRIRFGNEGNWKSRNMTAMTSTGNSLKIRLNKFLPSIRQNMYTMKFIGLIRSVATCPPLTLLLISPITLFDIRVPMNVAMRT